MKQSKFLTYQLIDCGSGERLEGIGDYTIRRPAANAVWEKSNPELWKKIDLEYIREGETRGSRVELTKNSFKEQVISYEGLSFLIKTTGFGHLGIFAEQSRNWQKIRETVASAKSSSCKILNLFAYTGGSSLAALQGGAEVVHVDASKATVEWARKNAEVNGLEQASVRWIVDDVMAFVRREIRRGNKYDGVILDPPSYGRGPKNQMWKIETHLGSLLGAFQEILAPDFKFILLSAHTPGYSCLVLENLLRQNFKCENHQLTSEEMVIPTESGFLLPSGTSAGLWR